MGRNAEKAEGHNGWKNYESWVVALWIDNEQESQEKALRLALEATFAAPALDPVKSGFWTVEQGRRYTLADSMRAWVSEDLLPDLGATLAADLMGAALSEVDWSEVADHYLADLNEQPAPVVEQIDIDNDWRSGHEPERGQS